jgi:hypothetical protein
MGWARVCLAVTVLALCAGCGNGRADAVNEYIAGSNRLTTGYAASASDTDAAFRRLARGQYAAAAPRLVTAERRLRELRRQIDLLEVPGDARQLHRRQLRLVDGQIELAHEAVMLARYQPVATRALTSVARAEATLRSRLRQARALAQQARAFTTFAAAVTNARAALSTTRAPPVLRSSRRAQLARLGAVAANSRQLAAALRRDDRQGIARLLQRQSLLVAGVQLQAEHRSRAAEIRAYNARVRALSRYASAAEAERRRLERSLN